MSTNRILDGDAAFPVGMRSASNPMLMPQGTYVRGVNIVNRGGLVHCRPGFQQRLRLPSGRLQGLTWFKPTGTEIQLVMAVAGRLYFSNPPFDTLVEIGGAQLSPYAERIALTRTEQSVRRNADNSRTLIAPRALLIAQDGVSPPVAWNGAVAEKILGEQTTPIGTAMAWSGNRLWVARDEFVFASDIFDPLSFNEGEYIGESSIGAFVMPGPVTALAEIPSVSDPALLVFTDSTTTLLQSGVLNRTLWLDTPNFQKDIFQQIGCVAPFSVLQHYGYLWWMSQKGVMNLNLALAAQTTSAMRLLDIDMAYSKRYLSTDLRGCAFGGHGGYMLASVPYASTHNRHTWCLDLTGLDSLTEDAIPGWAGYWTGIQPVQWVTTVVQGQERIFAASTDRDGRNRLWEAMQADADNGCPITWALVTRPYIFDSQTRKEFKYAKIWLEDLEGDVDVHVSWAAMSRGPFYEVCTKRITATPGNVRATLTITAEDVLYATRRQSRVLKTEDQRFDEEHDFSSCSVESDREDQIDVGFQICILVNGRGAVSSVRVYAKPENEELEGQCETDESNFRVSRYDGAGLSGAHLGQTLDLLAIPPSIWCSNATVTASYAGYTATAVGAACTSISQEAAAKLAQAIANMRVAQKLKENAPGYLGGWAVDCVVETAIP